MMNRLGFLLVLTSVSTAFGQGQADQYRQAATTYNNAAAQCQVPAAAACMRQHATYYSCLANQLGGGPSCNSAPSCSTSCPGGTSSGSGTPGAVGTALGAAGSTGSVKGDLLMAGVGLLARWGEARSNKRDADAAAAAATPGDSTA